MPENQDKSSDAPYLHAIYGCYVVISIFFFLNREKIKFIKLFIY